MPSATMTIDPAMLRAALHDLTQPVTLHYYTSDVESWYSFAERRLLEAIAQASTAITLQVHAARWDAQREAPVGIARTPAIALYGTHDTGIRYYGMPDGYELETFLSTLQAVATGTPGVQPDTFARLGQLTRPVHLEVVVSPTWLGCTSAVALATRLALTNPLVKTDVIMVNLFPYLAVRYQVDDVPTTVVNGVKTLVGPYDETEAVTKMLAAVAATER